MPKRNTKTTKTTIYEIVTKIDPTRESRREETYKTYFPKYKHPNKAYQPKVDAWTHVLWPDGTYMTYAVGGAADAVLWPYYLGEPL